MKKIFSIGETSDITGISVQTLRNYSNMGLVKPESVDKYTGYRYYTINQLHLLDKIKYMRELEIPINVIVDAIKSSDNAVLKDIFERQLKELRMRLQKLRESEEILEWYIDSIDYQEEMSGVKLPYIKGFEERKAIGTDYSGDNGPAQSEILISRLRHSKDGSRLRYLRQYGYVLSSQSFEKREFEPEIEFMFVKSADRSNIAENIEKHIVTFPKGDYLCFWDSKRLENVSEGIIDAVKNRKGKVLAIEYCDGLSDYGSNLKCEYQIYMGEK